ncbi:helix-turn-helix domain-containing protein [Rhodoligotrophos defluvii]|uniref:helix-turn-helix domain-containing protein n=1 Tax=Rhodoligotrophos defluvii TaxID=2561934 RepID=UPI0010C98E4B|nr:helix-turn-helix domain-containing protein [Rhodoligotrophos defluvii]
MSKMTREKIDKGLALYAMGVPVRQIAKELDVSHTLVWRYITPAGQRYIHRYRNEDEKAKHRIVMRTRRAVQKLMEG